MKKLNRKGNFEFDLANNKLAEQERFKLLQKMMKNNVIAKSNW